MNIIWQFYSIYPKRLNVPISFRVSVARSPKISYNDHYEICFSFIFVQLVWIKINSKKSCCSYNWDDKCRGDTKRESRKKFFWMIIFKAVALCINLVLFECFGVARSSFFGNLNLLLIFGSLKSLRLIPPEVIPRIA